LANGNTYTVPDKFRNPHPFKIISIYPIRIYVGMAEKKRKIDKFRHFLRNVADFDQLSKLGKSNFGSET
jgi:hypothetical protein